MKVKRELRSFKTKVKKVIGIDIDEQAKTNPLLDEFILIKPEEPWPIPADSVDIAICDYVLEHVENPDFFFAECKRVIKKGGYLCIRTPNLFNYITLLSRLVPNRFHSELLKKPKKASLNKTSSPPATSAIQNALSPGK